MRPQTQCLIQAIHRTAALQHILRSCCTLWYFDDELLLFLSLPSKRRRSKSEPKREEAHPLLEHRGEPHHVDHYQAYFISHASLTILLETQHGCPPGQLRPGVLIIKIPNTRVTVTHTDSYEWISNLGMNGATSLAGTYSNTFFSCVVTVKKITPGLLFVCSGMFPLHQWPTVSSQITWLMITSLLLISFLISLNNEHA